MCRLAILLTSIFVLFFVTPTYSQSLLLNKGESGLGVEFLVCRIPSPLRYVSGTNTYGMAIGYSHKGIFDIGLFAERIGQWDSKGEGRGGGYISYLIIKENKEGPPFSFQLSFGYSGGDGGGIPSAGIAFSKKGTQTKRISIFPTISFAVSRYESVTRTWDYYSSIVHREYKVAFSPQIALPVSVNISKNISIFASGHIARDFIEGIPDQRSYGISVGLIYKNF